MSKVELVVQGGLPTSLHLSGIVNGLTQVSAFAGEASAVATAPTSTVLIPIIGPRKVAIGLPRALVRKTCTRTRMLVGKVTSPGTTDAFTLMTRFCGEVDE